MFRFVLSIFLFFIAFDSISGRGRMIKPSGRSSLWRVNPQARPNYSDDLVDCGGKGIQWGQLNGKCGVCGDRYDDPHPQANENTGKYGQGIIAETYTSGSIIDIEIELTTNKMGYFTFSLCVLDDPSLRESGEECFTPLTLGDGSEKYVLTNTEEIHSTTYEDTTVQLPQGLTCERCVLRWHYNTGNSWGQCDDGTYAMGCGPQETFRSCADIAIV